MGPLGALIVDRQPEEVFPPCSHRCRFALAETRVGCIDRQLEEILLGRSGLIFGTTPLYMQERPTSSAEPNR